MKSNEEISRSALITGNALGINGAISRRLATDGSYVIIDEASLTNTVNEITPRGGNALPVLADVTTEQGVATLKSKLEHDSEQATLCLLVSNGGAPPLPQKPCFTKRNASHWQALHNINLGNVLSVSHPVIPRMIAAGGGSIVSAFTKTLTVEVHPSDIRVNIIAPDLTDTPLTPAQAQGRDLELTHSWLPLGLFGIPDDHSGVVSFQSSDAAQFITGHMATTDGGTLAASGW